MLGVPVWGGVGCSGVVGGVGCCGVVGGVRCTGGVGCSGVRCK